jgi:hypothetical protein
LAITGLKQSSVKVAELYCAQGRYAEAEPLYVRALAIWEKALGGEHPHVATVLESYALLLILTGRQAEGSTLKARAETIRAHSLRVNFR